MKTITLKPTPSGEYRAFIRLAVTGATPITLPFPAEQLSIERKSWENGGFKVVVKENKFAPVE